jgi:serine/threonine-protein kinase
MAKNILAPGTVLSGRYQVVEAIGESDLSNVYLASDQRGQAQIALKVFDTAVMARAAALSEYQTLARQASGLGVEGIARAYDFGIDANTGVPFSTAERIGWVSLDRRVAAQGPLGVVELSRSFGVLARALDAAHASRVVHRDLKPQNVFISPDNPEWVRITDFGMSAVRRGAPEAMGWGGPPGYTPPDAVDASAAGTPGADLFALGVIAFFALTRGTPFRSLRSPGFDPNSHWTELNQSLSPLSERAKEIGVALDPLFDTWFARALAITPQERFRSAGEMARDLAYVAEQVSARGGGGPRSMPGIAAAIAQPLVFQPEPSPASLGLAATAPQQQSPMAAMAAQAAPAQAAAAQPMYPPNANATMVSGNGEEHGAGVPKKGMPVGLLVGGAILLLGGLATAGYLVLGRSSGAKPEPSASAAVSAAPPPVTAQPSTAPARARFTCQPEACDWVVCDGKNVTGLNDEIEFVPGNHDCSASRNGFGSKSLSFTATAGQTTPVNFELPPLPAATQAKAAAAAAAAKPATAAAPAPATKATPAPATKAAPATTSKPASKDTASKSTTKSKKKCSAFLGCK